VATIRQIYGKLWRIVGEAIMSPKQSFARTGIVLMSAGPVDKKMKIASIEIGKLRVPLKTPFKTALRIVTEIEDVVVILTTHCGRKGYGSAPSAAVITGETHDTIIEAIRSSVFPAVVGESVQDLTYVSDLIQSSIERNFSARAAVEIAVYDLFAQSQESSLYRVLGGGNPVISTDLTISVDHIDKMVADSLLAVDRGFASLKIKVGKGIEQDVERIKAIDAAVGDRAMLRLDANQGWTPKETVAALRELEDSGVVLDLIEQPVHSDDIDGMKYVCERVTTPVMADESAFGPKEVTDIIQRRAADIINIKLMKAGGIMNAIKIADIAATHGVECMIGCMAETSISVSAAAHLAVSRASVITRVDLDSPLLAAKDPIRSNVSFDDSKISISDTPGLGITDVDGIVPL
jgi:L-alanine-DL-glutamate epimerase-like enolase superfamily enzyme